MFSFVLLAALAAVDASEAAPKTVAVLEVSASVGAAPQVADIFSEIIQGEIRDRGIKVIGRSDIDQLLGLEKMKDALGCNSSSCLAEIGGALGVDELLTGSIAKLGDYLVITLKRIDPRRGEVRRQATRKLKGASENALVEAAGPLVAELFGLPKPASPEVPVAPLPFVELRAADMSRSQDIEVGGPWGPGLIHNAPPYKDRPNMAEYEVKLPAAGPYELWIEYAAEQPRPVEVWFNGTRVNPAALSQPTGGWSPKDCRWSKEAVVSAQAGTNTIRLSRSSYFPHIRALKLVLVREAPPQERTPDVVKAVVTAGRAPIRACYDVDRARKGTPAGRVELSFVIDPSGVVVSTEVRATATTLQSTELHACMQAALRQVRFPASPAGQETKVTYPFQFDP